jgi:UTP:GlnB (protein PII) uridylyltransferase
MPKDYLHLKEMPGGLREIDLCLAAAKAGHRVRETWMSTVFGRLVLQDPANTARYEKLNEVSNFLVALRSAYRVSVAASDVLERGWLGAPARILGLEKKGGSDPAGYLYDEVCRILEESAGVIDEVMDSLFRMASGGSGGKTPG